jgi:hypothetical protein
MRIKKKKKKKKNHVFLNRNGEHIAGYLIHLNKYKTKLTRISTIYVLKFVKSIPIYYIKCVCPRIWVGKVYVQELR